MMPSAEVAFLQTNLSSTPDPIPLFIVLLGPTAVGKSTIAVELAKAVGGEIVTLDSMQVYRRLNIGTAKPTLAEQQGIPHHLIDVVDPDVPFTATDFARLAREALKDISTRGHLPLVVGGSGLYLRALRGEIFPGPPEVPTMRARLGEEVERGGPEKLHTRLKSLDPLAASKIHPRDAFRLIRALEIIEVTGERVSDLWKAHRKGLTRPLTLLLGFRRQRADLYGRINNRVDRMVESGLVDEVRQLLEAGYPPDLKPFQSHNYRHIITFLLGRKSLEEAVSQTMKETRHYAKRQMTWFRREEGITWLDLTESESGVTGALIQRIQGVRKRYGTA